MKALALIASLTLICSGCISIKSEYPTIAYYKMEQEQLSFPAGSKIPGTLLLRMFTTNSDYDTDQILAKKKDGKIKRYYYHRWISDPDEMLTHYLLDRLLQYQIFDEGVILSSSALLPDYILEGRILEMMAVNGKSEVPNSSYVYLRIHVSFLKIIPGAIERPVLLQKQYEIKATRRNNNVKSIHRAYSAAMAQLADELLLDLARAVDEFASGQGK